MLGNFPIFDYYKQKRLHLGVCGSVAAYKMLDLMRRFQDCGIQVNVTLTPSAQKFVTPLSFEALGAGLVYGEMFDHTSPFAHLEPGQVADAMLIAPATASTLSRLAMGLADEMLACQALAFDGPVLLAPAMNPKMWANVATEQNVDTLLERGYFLMSPDCGTVACQEHGTGKLAEIGHIYLETLKLLTEQDLFGKKVMVNLGPTQEKWDAVRVWTNKSTGSMGAAFALAAWLRGAEVHTVCGPVKQFFPKSDTFFRYDAHSAQEMFRVCENLWEQMDIGVFTAAVSDFRPTAQVAQASRPLSQASEGEEKNAVQGLPTTGFVSQKFKKEQYKQGFDVHFAPNPDILKTLGRRKAKHQKIIGFAAESDGSSAQMSQLAMDKLQKKNCDLLVGNTLSHGMGTKDNQVVVAEAKGKVSAWPTMAKTDLAWDLLTLLCTA